MKGIKVAIDNILETLNDKLDFWQPIYEALSNSLEANATQIDVYLNTKANLLNEDCLDSIQVVDNGDGFDQANFESFNEFLSAHKRNKGCKGIGHFTWLKVFQNVHIESYTKDSSYLNFAFNTEYDPTAVKITPVEGPSPSTSIEFQGILQNYNNAPIIISDLDKIKNQIENHLIVKLSLMNNDGKSFSINIHHNKEMVTINNANIIKLSSKQFSLSDPENQHSYLFNLYYSFFDATPKRRDLFYCANGRTVIQFSNSIKIDQLPDNSSLIMLLTSPYFDERVSNLRNRFTFELSENNPSLTNPIPFPKINEQLQKTVDQVIIQKYPTFIERNEDTIQACITEFPYLGKYIRQDTTLIKNKKKIIEKAQKAYKEEKESVKQAFYSMLQKQNIDETEFSEMLSKVNDISARELTQYFLYREQILNALYKLKEENSEIEKKLHDLLAPRGTVSIAEDKHYYDTNIWLLDDKYLTYSEMFSDKSIKVIKEHLGAENQKTFGEYKEPDLTIFYNNIGEENKDLVVIELKALGISPDRKMTALSEINRNLQFISSGIDKIRNIYGYVITEIDPAFQAYLEAQPGMKRLFSKGNTPFYYFYNENIKDKNNEVKGAHIYIMSVSSIYQDAKMRNDTFINIIKNK